MKRSGFQNKPRKPLKKTPLARVSSKPKKKVKRVKLVSISKLKKILWQEVRQHIIKRENSICFTSGVQVEGSNRHVGHGIPSSVGGILLRYHPLNLHVQSYVENIHHSGNGGEYYRRQVLKYGQEKVDKLYELKNASAKGDRYFYATLLELYITGNEQAIIEFLEAYR